MKKAYRKYLLLAGALFLLLSLPLWMVEKGRVRLIALFSPVWKSHAEHSQVQKLEAENHLLRIEIGKLRGLLNMGELVQQENVLPAHVIYRDPSSWMSGFWVDVGSENGRGIIDQNSPVLVGNAVVGIVDYVGKRQSRIRLITDMGLKPSVRAVRGRPQSATFIEHIDALLSCVKSSEDQKVLERLRQEYVGDAAAWYLAKGVIQGAGAPLWRNRTQSIRGLGFNYDFADSFGPARELRTGKPLDESSPLTAMPIIQEGDLLVTTGMDGVFPVGLKVAEVTKVYPLREGAYSYEIDAAAVVKNLDSVQTVLIVPKVGYQPE